MIFLEIKVAPQCLPIHSQYCTMRQLNLDVDIQRTFKGDHTVIRFSGWRSEIVPKQGVDLAALHAFA